MLPNRRHNQGLSDASPFAVRSAVVWTVRIKRFPSNVIYEGPELAAETFQITL